ncbi:MAG: hypothetical protein GX638_18995 [Crenarchaeota archaeon]|nr:hypothetical protein [Thermoproteota archaeon]
MPHIISGAPVWVSVIRATTANPYSGYEVITSARNVSAIYAPIKDPPATNVTDGPISFVLWIKAAPEQAPPVSA